MMLSFRRRLALVHFLVVAGVMAVAAGAGTWAFDLNLRGELDDALLSLADLEAGMLSVAEAGAPIVVHETPHARAPSFTRMDRLVQIVGARGEVIARSSNLGTAALPIAADLHEQLAGGAVFEQLDRYAGESTRMVSVPVPNRPDILAVQVAASTDDLNHTVANVAIMLLLLTVVLILAVGVSGELLTRRVFIALDDIVHQARRIGQRNLADRLPHPGVRDEIGRLVDTLNEMLERLEHGIEAQRNFTADASHELRSPLSRLRAELEIALRRPRDTGTYVEALRSALDEVESLTVLVEELLVLARLDAGQERGEMERVPLGELVQDVVRRMGAAARQRQVAVTVSGDAGLTVLSARGAVQLALTNLLDNAIKYSPPGGSVAVCMEALPATQEACVSVTDSGPGIDAGELPRLFERFFRGSRARDIAGGFGLGLALAQTLVQVHGGRITGANAPGQGARFELRLTRAPA